MQLHLHVPEQLTDKSQQQLEALAFEALVVRLYALGELSSGEGAKLLGLTRREFLNLLSSFGGNCQFHTVAPPAAVDLH